MSDLQSDLDKTVTGLKAIGPVILLESQLTQHPQGNTSFVAGMPRVQLIGRGNVLEIIEHNDTKKTSLKGNIWNLASDYLANHPDWYFGYLGYDLKNDIEKLYSNNGDPIGAPDLWMFSPGYLLEVDHPSDHQKILRNDHGLKFEKFQQKNREIHIGPLCYSVTPQAYQQTIEKAKRFIYEGDIYELNLAHQSKAKFTGDSFELYKKMRQAGPVPFGAYLHLSRQHIDVCCASPERFLAKKGTHICSHPIKGTIKRSDSPVSDQKLKKTLLASKKEQAENLMIVDLVRHDLNKIALPGSVKVEKLFDIETYKTVHQMVSQITATTYKNNVMDTIKSCFPMGSMTGAPKIRVMQRIEELELFKRGIYSGAIGYITPNNNFDFNVVIRTAIIKKNQLYYAAGGAITSDSNPKNEWNETLLKKQALINV